MVAIVAFMLVAGGVFGVGIWSDNVTASHLGPTYPDDSDCADSCADGQECKPVKQTAPCPRGYSGPGGTSDCLKDTNNYHCVTNNPTFPPPPGSGGDSGGTSCAAGQICNPIGSNNFKDLLNNIIRWLTIFATPVLVLMIVYAGFLYTTSGGSTTQTDKAKSVIKHAVIGFVIIGLAYVIKSIVGSIF